MSNPPTIINNNYGAIVNGGVVGIAGGVFSGDIKIDMTNFREYGLGQGLGQGQGPVIGIMGGHFQNDIDNGKKNVEWKELKKTTKQ